MDYSHLHFVWFSFTGDSRCLEESIASVRQAAPGARLSVAQEAERPVLPDSVARIGEGVEWLETLWDRGGNLNGHAHLVNQVRLLAACAPHAGAVVKIDCDMVIQNADWLAGHDYEAQPSICLGQPAWWYQGGCYAISSAIMHMLIQAVMGAPDFMTPHPGWPEDQVTGEVIARTWGAQSIATHHGYPVGNGIAHYNYRENSPFSSYFPFDVVNFGSRDQIPAPAMMRRNLAADTMRAFRAQAALQPRPVP